MPTMTRKSETGRWLVHFDDNMDLENGIAVLGPMILVGESRSILMGYLSSIDRGDLIYEMEAETENIAY